MKRYCAEQIINQLEARKGGYYYLKIDAEIVNQFTKKRKTRFICRLNEILDFQCGLNHFGDGHFFIILSKKNLATIGKELGDMISFELWEDPNPLGVDMPETLEVLLQQDRTLKELFQNLTLGKRRSIIHQINKIKNIDKQISKSIALIQALSMPGKKNDTN